MLPIHRVVTLSFLGAFVLTPAPVRAAVIDVAPGQSVQAAIDAARDGDTVRLAAGTYDGDIDFTGKALTVVGVGPDSVVRGTGTGPVVRFLSGEMATAVLDSVTITGGLSIAGGGIHINGASPTIVRTIVIDNHARSQGSGIYVAGGNPEISNNLIVYNGTAQGDPHSVEIVDAAPLLVNNTIARGDSNGIILRGNSPAIVMNNMIIMNGATVNGDRRGRGICDFSGGRARIHYNLFARNRIGALLTNGTDFRRIARAQSEIGGPRLVGNIDGPARLAARIRRYAADAQPGDFRLRNDGARVPARDAGNPDPVFDDADGTRNDIGFGGGPLAADWAR